MIFNTNDWYKVGCFLSCKSIGWCIEMKKYVLNFIILWYFLTDFLLYKIFDRSWKIFIYDLSGFLTECNDYYAHCLVLLTMILLVLYCILYLVGTNKIKIVVSVNICNWKIRFYQFKFLRKIINVVFILIWIISALNISIKLWNLQKSSYESKEWKNYITIAHAGGELDGYTSLNCKDAIISNYKKGQRVFELDLVLTKDNKIVGKHDWYDNEISEGMLDNYVPTEEEFLSIPLWGGV